MNPRRYRTRFPVRAILKWTLIIAVIFGGGYTTIALLNAQRLAKNNDHLTESLALLTRLTELELYFKDTESTQRAYLASGDRHVFSSFDKAITQLTVVLDHLDELAPKAGVSASSFGLLRRSVTQKIDELKQIVATHDERGSQASMATARSGQEATLFKSIDPVIAELKRAERDHLMRRAAESAAAIREATIAVIVITILSLLFVAGFYVFVNRLLSNQERDEHDLREQAERWRVTLGSIDDATIVTDAASTIRFINPVAEFLCDCQQNDPIGLPIESIFRVVNKETGAILENPVAQAIALGHAGFPQRATLITGRGTERPVVARAVPIRNPEKSISSVVLIFRDVTQQLRDEENHRLSLTREQEHTRQLRELAHLSTQLHLAHDFDAILNLVAAESCKLFDVHRVEATIEPSTEPRAENAIELPITGRDGKNLAYLRVTLEQTGQFDDQDRAILDQLVQMTSVAIENASLYRELRENDNSKDRFLAMLGHELRNPLAAISNAVTLGRHAARPESLSWSIDVIDRQTLRLTRLIDDLLDVSRITQGKIRLHRQPVELSAVVDSAIEAVRPLIEQRKHTVETVIPSKAFWVEGDTTRLEQIFTNLLTNAAKYTKSRGRIKLAIIREGNDIVARVKDSGIGIPSDLLPRIFDLFTQGDRSLNRAEGGLGIGLTLVKTLTELHGGSVRVTSDGLDKGTEFTVRLPATSEPLLQSSNNGQPGHRPETPHRPIRVLVVDDNIDLAIGLSKVIMQLGHAVQIANDGPAALDLARTFRPEAVLLDIGLPGMDGFEVAARLRADEEVGSMVLAAISGYGQEEDRRRSLEAGFHFHLVKPIDLDALRQIINRIGRPTPAPLQPRAPIAIGRPRRR